MTDSITVAAGNSKSTSDTPFTPAIYLDYARCMIGNSSDYIFMGTISRNDYGNFYYTLNNPGAKSHTSTNRYVLLIGTVTI